MLPLNFYMATPKPTRAEEDNRSRDTTRSSGRDAQRLPDVLRATAQRPPCTNSAACWLVRRQELNIMQNIDERKRATDHDRSLAAASTGADVAPHTKLARAAGVDMKNSGWAGWATCCRKLEEVAAHLQHVNIT